MAVARGRILPPERPFVGRTEELAALRAHVIAAAAGQGGVVLVTGEPGIGKTRLVEEAIRGVAAGRVTWGRCYDAEGSPAYWPWIQALRRYVADLPAARLRREVGADGLELARLLPQLGARPGAAETRSQGDPDEPRLVLFEAVASFLRRVTAAKPLVIVLDDLHWADRETLLLLHYVARELTGSRVLVLATLRETEMRQATAVRRAVHDLLRACPRIRLAGLTVQDVASVIGALDDSASPAGLADVVHRATDGNPFFVGEVLHLLRDEGRLGAPLAAGFRMPDSVLDVVARRLDPLPAGVVELLSVAAIVGRNFEVEVLAMATGASAAAVLETLAPARALGIVVALAAAGRLGFAHALVQEALVRQLSPARVPALHQQVAEAIEARYGTDLDPFVGELARHWFLAAPLGAPDKGIAYAERAADIALSRLGYDEAAGHLERALRAVSAAGLPSHHRLRLLVRFGETQRLAGDEEGARGTLLEAVQLAKELGLSQIRAAAVLLCGGTGAETGGVDVTIINLTDEALHDLESDAIELRASLLSLLVRALYFTPDVERREAASLEALTLARRPGVSLAVLGRALTARHMVLWGPGRVEERLALATEALDVCRSAGRWDLVYDVYGWRILDLFELGDIAGVDRELVRYQAAAERIRVARAHWEVGLIRATRALLDGDLAAAERLAMAATTLRHPTPHNNVSQFFTVQLFTIREEQGRLVELAPVFEAMATRGWRLPIWRTGEAMIHIVCGRRDDAIRVLQDLAARGFTDLPRDGTWIATVCRLAELCDQLSQPAVAAVLLPQLLPYAALWGVMGLNVVSQGAVARYVGLLALTIGDADTAVVHLERAVEANRSQGAQIQLGHALADLARALTARGRTSDVARADALRTDARAIADRLDLVWLRTRLGEPAPGPSRSAPGAIRRAALRREGEVWTVSCDHEVVRIRDSKGLVYLRELLRHPNREFHVLDLVGADGQRATDAGEVLDADARQSYKRRLQEIQAELAEADEWADLGRVERLRAEMDAVAGELARGVGLGGRTRRSGSAVERARLNATRALRGVLRKICAECPVIGNHLESRVVTGTFCQYEPDPGFPVSWDL